MYASKTTAGLTGVSAVGLAETGVNALFWVLTAVLLVVVGLTLVRLFQSRPSQIMTGPKPLRSKQH